MRSHLLQSLSLSFLGQKSFFILAVYMIFCLSLVSHILTGIYLDESFFICHGCDSLFFLKSRINIFHQFWKILSFLSEFYFHLSFFFFYHLETLIKCVTLSCTVFHIFQPLFLSLCLFAVFWLIYLSPYSPFAHV